MYTTTILETIVPSAWAATDGPGEDGDDFKIKVPARKGLLLRAFHTHFKMANEAATSQGLGHSLEVHCRADASDSDELALSSMFDGALQGHAERSRDRKISDLRKSQYMRWCACD